MGLLAECGYVREITSSSGSNISYVLNDNNDFSLTEYKVLQSQSNAGLIKCMQMLYNGKIELYYLTSGYRSFASMLPSLDGNGFMTIMGNLLNTIIEVKNNGFLSYEKIEISPDKIFIHPSNLSVGLIYVPIQMRGFKDILSFETDLRTNLIRLIDGLPSLRSRRINEFYQDLSNGTLTLEALANKIMGISVIPNDCCNETGLSVMSLVALNAPAPFDLTINKEEFLIGKSRSKADGLISFNKAISRAHCKILRTNGSYFLIDLKSTNGTYLNGVRLQPHKPVPVKNGDIIRLANLDFRVRIL